MEACLSVKLVQRHQLMAFFRLGRRWHVAPEERAITPLRICIVQGADDDMMVKGELSTPGFSYDQGLIEFKGTSKMDSYIVIKG